MNKDYTLPHQDLISLVPQNLRNPMLTSLIDNLFNRFLTRDEAVPLYGYVGRKPASVDDRTPKIPQQSTERDINALIPVLSFKVGTEVHSFTVQDLIRKAEVLGISANQSTWLYSQSNNYSPPIDLERFTNFFNYYWVAQGLPSAPALSWNPTLSPEYYVIAAPKNSGADKLNVVTSTTGQIVLSGTGFYQQTWVIDFLDAQNFTITASGPGISAAERVQSYALPETGPLDVQYQAGGKVLLEFTVVRDPIYSESGVLTSYESFVTGDKFSITAPFISSVHSVTPNVGPGVKGKITAIDSLDTYQTIGGVVVKAGDRVLVKNQGASAENGIYTVQPGTFTRAGDYSGETAVAGARVFDAHASKTYISEANQQWVLTGDTTSNTSDWQEANFWYHRDELDGLGLDRSKIIQAVRPIIQYEANVELNSTFKDGAPSATGTTYRQSKTEFNQAPLFNLYRYNGTHAGKVSAIFFYAEDPTAAIDPALQRRLAQASNQSADFLFAHGLAEGDNSLLFYRTTDAALHTIWHPGYGTAAVIEQQFAGDGTGSLVVTAGNPFAQQQIWTLTALTGTTFAVEGSKLKVLPAEFSTAAVGVPYSNGELNVSITAGSTPFTPGDVFTISVGAFESARYVYRDEDEAIFDFFGGPVADVAGIGAWQVPRMFYANVAADNGAEIPEGTLYSHFRSILTNQLPGTAQNRAFGGAIKLWSEQQNLLASLLMQRDLTPVSVVDLAQRQYETATNSIADLFTQEFVNFLSANTANPSATELTDFLLNQRLRDGDVRSVLYDSTSPVIGFPATLPQLGVSALVQPAVIFDNELGVSLLRNHDGHLTPLYQFTSEFRDRLLLPGTLVKRSDGTFTPAVGSFTETPPAQPFKGELWFNGSDLRVFNVISDERASPVATAIGDYWYNRGSNILSMWDGALWIAQPNLTGAFISINPASLLNSVIMEIETRLFNGINSEARYYFSETDISTALTGPLRAQLQRELAVWAAANGYDPTAPDYVNTDAFTWNYSSAGLPARWFNALTAHQQTIPGVLKTARPNLDPWRLLGFETKPPAWDSSYAAEITLDMIDAPANGYITGQTARVVLFSAVQTNTILSGLPVVDGRQLSAGQTVLLVSEASPANNGLWTVASHGWARAGTALVEKLVIQITDGESFAGTEWVLRADAPNLNTSPVVFTQARSWKSTMWTDIQAARPGLKLSVDTNRDMLLPPYVNSGFAYSTNALTTTLPPAPTRAYVFGEGSPVETVWTKSVEFRYSLARALFRADPMGFLGHLWGFKWVEVDGILYDSFDMAVPGHRRFKLHGDPIAAVARTPEFLFSSVTGLAGTTFSITHDGYTADRAQSFSVAAKGVIVGYLRVGAGNTVSGQGFSIADAVINDGGKPFRIGDKFSVTVTAGLPVVIFEPATHNQILGFGQVFSHALREGSIDTTQGYAIQAYRGWDVNLGYRAGGLVSTDDLRVFNDVESLPESAFALRFKRSPYARDLWLQGLRVSVVQIGSSNAATVSGFVPAGDASDWVFRVDGYNARFLEVSFSAFDTAGDRVSFTALNGEHTALPWYQPTTELSTPVVTQLPLTITGLQNVLNFLFGYAQLREKEGWRFSDGLSSNIDAGTGRTRNWQLEVEKLVDRVYAGIQLGQGHVINPFMDRVWLDQDVGLLSKFFDSSLFDITGHPGVFDTLGAKINTTDLTILRSRGKSQIGSSIPMFSVHAQVDEYEHLFVFNNLTSPSTNEGLIYDPFSGARISTIKLNGRRQAAQTLRPEFGGHYLVGDEVKQNLQASTDKIAHYYDADHVFEDETSTRHALALLGFSPKKYMDDLDITERTQFNFWRGLVQMKGTNSSIDAFLNNDRFEDAKIDEYWAYKVAEYGDSRSRVFPELKVLVSDTLQQFTKFQFDSNTLQNFGFKTILRGDEGRWFTLDDLDGETAFEAQVVGTYIHEFTEFDARGAAIIYPLQVTLPFVADELVDLSGAQIINDRTLYVLQPGTVSVTGYGPATPKFNPIKLFNYVDAELIEEIPQWHPLIGQHTPTALESINIISDIDPARYNVSTQVVGNSNFDPLRTWGTKELGRVWWDTTNLEYTPYSDDKIYGSIDERLSRWGTLADFSTVDVVEWIESRVPPTEYDALALVDSGNADLDVLTRADGQVYGAKTYSRTRIWQTRPVAWSHAGVAIQAAHPAFNGSFFSNLTLVEKEETLTAVLESSTFKILGISAGMRLGAWQQDDSHTRPLSEFLVLDGFSKFISLNNPDLDQPLGVVSIESVGNTDVVGELLFIKEPTQRVQERNDAGEPINMWTVSTYLRAVEVSSGKSTVQLVNSSRVTGVLAKPAVAATRGYQAINFGSTKTEASKTGLRLSTDPATVTVYSLVITLDGTALTVTFTGDEAQTFGELISVINSQFPGAPAKLDQNRIIIISGTSGADSTVSIGNSALFADLNDFDLLGTSIAGENLIPAVQETINDELQVFADQVLVVPLLEFGLSISVRVTENNVYGPEILVDTIVDALRSSVELLDAVQVLTLVPLSDPSGLVGDGLILSNDPTDPANVINNGVGWRAWSVPSQDELDADTKVPNNSWLPYPGAFVSVEPTIELIKLATNNAALSLNDGTSPGAYQTTWGAWAELESTVLRTTATTMGFAGLAVPAGTTKDLISVYVNGAAQLSGTFTLVGTALTVQSVAFGSEVVVIIRPYAPLQSELDFDPEVNDVLLIQSQYKIDYQYVAVPVRDSEGQITRTKYFFWVKNRSTQARRKKLSIRAVTQLLITGPSNYLTFQNFGGTGSASNPYSYDAITISGLSYVVTKDDTFKLRFTRNFTLRDDSQELDLKNTHVEWALIRPGQRTRIPEALWDKMVNTACGADAAGNILPSPRRASYDERNGTRTQFGFGSDQVLAPSELVKSTLLFTVLNTALVDDSGAFQMPDYMTFLDFSKSDSLFSSAENTRNTMSRIWNTAKPSQINELFFAVLNDICAAQYEMTDIFKTSRLSAYSIKVVRSAPIAPSYE